MRTRRVARSPPTVAARAPGLLVVVFQRLGERVVQHVTHIPLVDAQSERCAARPLSTDASPGASARSRRSRPLFRTQPNAPIVATTTLVCPCDQLVYTFRRSSGAIAAW